MAQTLSQYAAAIPPELFTRLQTLEQSFTEEEKKEFYAGLERIMAAHQGDVDEETALLRTMDEKMHAAEKEVAVTERSCRQQDRTWAQGKDAAANRSKILAIEDEMNAS